MKLHIVPKRQKKVLKPNLGIRMSDFRISVNNVQIRFRFLMKIIVLTRTKNVFEYLWELCICLNTDIRSRF